MKAKKYKKNNFKRNDNRSNIDIKSQFKKVEVGIKNGVFVFVNNLTIDEFSKKINKPTTEIIKYLFLKGINCNLNTLLDEEQMGELCLEFGYDFKKEVQINEDNFLDNISFNDDEETLSKRPPIVTVMGHVDHGKTSLLDAIRKTRVVDTEAGNITQSIGAYQVEWNKNLITFFDTPGHEAFSEMRAMGADLTDIAVIVVAADDGLKPQTEEAIDHAKFAKVPIIIFINKIDKPGTNIEKIYSQLSEKDIVPEEWGGKTIVIKGSALNKTGINELLEAIILTSEIMELKANKDRVSNGITIEASLDKGEGPVADLLVQSGTLAINDYILIGNHYGKIRKMVDFNRRDITHAPPSTPVRISGINGVPNAGDKWIVTKNEKELKELALKRQKSMKQKKFLNIASKLKTIDDENIKELNVLLKADNHGSVQALKSLISSIDIEGTKINLIRSSVGLITESDINLARAAKSLVFSFNLKTPQSVQEYANSMGISIKNFSIIYDVKDEIERVLKGKLDPVYVEKEIGKVEIRQLWSHSSIGTIAGCRVLEGEIKRNALARIHRDKKLIVENKKINSLRHGKENISLAAIGKECGFTIENFNNFIEGDIVEIYEIVEETNE